MRELRKECEGLRERSDIKSSNAGELRIIDGEKGENSRRKGTIQSKVDQRLTSKNRALKR
jgi:hypothetical protein